MEDTKRVWQLGNMIANYQHQRRNQDVPLVGPYDRESTLKLADEIMTEVKALRAVIEAPYLPVQRNRVSVEPGDVVRVLLPHSEAMMAAGKAGQIHLVRVGNTSAQLINDVGTEWGAPYLPIEVGIGADNRGENPRYYAYGKLHRLELREAGQ